MRVLILNWRDVRTPHAGGAERVTHEIAKRLVAGGHRVTWLSATNEALPPEEIIDGVRVVRRGSEVSTRLFAPRLAAEGYDVVVDAINTIPYFAQLWSRAPVVAFFHQLARNVWWWEARLPVSLLGWLAEPLGIRLYRRVPAVTVSLSTRDDLRRYGLRADISVIPLAVGARPQEPREKKLDGRLVAIGRLTSSKRFDHAISAVADLRRTHPAATLDIVGVGGEEERLRELIRSQGLEDAVRLRGRLSEQERDALLANADAVLGTSVREGWGLTMTEAARFGTPGVAYAIPGFRDSIVDRRTGRLTQSNPPALADGVRWLLDDPERYRQLQQAASEHAAPLDWDRTAAAFERVLLRVTRRRG